MLVSPRLAGFPAGLHETEAVLDLAEQRREILSLLRGKAGQNLLLPAQQARDQFLVQRFALPRHAQLVLAAVLFVFDAFDHAPPPPRRARPADGLCFRSGAMRTEPPASRHIA